MLLAHEPLMRRVLRGPGKCAVLEAWLQTLGLTSSLSAEICLDHDTDLIGSGCAGKCKAHGVGASWLDCAQIR